jgi:hypothetical protein
MVLMPLLGGFLQIAQVTRFVWWLGLTELKLKHKRAKTSSIIRDLTQIGRKLDFFYANTQSHALV